jgi:fructose/tagatose bisphosphate aldolase
MQTLASLRLQSPRQLANDGILNAEIIDLIRFFLLHGHGSTRGLKTTSHRFVPLLGVPWRRPSCELILQEIKQAVESGVCKVNFRHSRSAVQSKAPGG